MPSREIRTCFVTGGTGFIGSHLVEYLLRMDCQVRCLVRNPSRLAWLEGKPVTVVEGDLDSPLALREGISGAEAVFHLGGVTAAPSRAAYWKVNAEGSRKVARASLEAEHPPDVFVYMSSLAAAGPGHNGEVAFENQSSHPVTDYGRSKLEGERLLSEMGPLPLVVVRPPAVYGPRDRGMLPLFRLAARGIIPVFNTRARISLVHVEDLVRGVYVAAARGRLGENYFLTHPQPLDAVDFPALLGKAMGRRVRALAVPGPFLGAAAALSETWGRFSGRMPLFNRDKVKELTAFSWVCDWQKAHREMGFLSEKEADAGLSDTAQWYRENGWL